MRTIEEHRCSGGVQGVYEHDSEITGTPMRFAVYRPPRSGPRPVLTWLSGLTCTEQNFIQKAGAQRYAAELGLVLVAPDTSPRGDSVPDAEGWDLGKGASFYLDATRAPWSESYRMYSYLTKELPELLARHFPVDLERHGISGHSMGGHGALVLALRNPGLYRSVSAFAPICAPSRCPWGEKAFTAYLGPDRESWAHWDATEILRARGWLGEILVDQGMADEFLAQGQLQPEALEAACEEATVPLQLNRREGYDHSYYFVASFIGEHLRWHADQLR